MSTSEAREFCYERTGNLQHRDNDIGRAPNSFRLPDGGTCLSVQSAKDDIGQSQYLDRESERKGKQLPPPRRRDMSVSAVSKR